MAPPMRNPKEKIRLEIKKFMVGQYGGTEDDAVVGEFETIENQYKKYAGAIGSYIISFAQLEGAVDNDLATAINERAHEPGYRIIKYLSFRNKVNLLLDEYTAFIKYCLMGQVRARLITEVKVIHKKLCELSEFRNRVAHANWESLDAAGFVRTKIIESKDDVGMEFEKVKMTPGVLSKFRRQNEAMANRLDLFRERMWAANNRQSARMYRKLEAEKKSLKGQRG